MKKLIVCLLFMLSFTALKQASAQNINPKSQINWSNSTGCATTGQPYVPASNSCIPLGFVLLSPAGAQSITQPSLALPLSVNYLSPMFINGAVNAAAFCGSGTVGGITLPACSADACAKLYAANQYAVANGSTLVDASGFSGVQACHSNPFASLNSTIGANVSLSVRFGTTHFQTFVPWIITNSGVALQGAGPFSTQVEYVGSSCTSTPGACAVLWANTDSGSGVLAEQGGPNGVVIRDMFFYGGAANVTDGVILSSSRSNFDNVYAWGATTCGIRMHGAEENHFNHPVVSNTTATFIGISSAAHTTPANGICFDANTTQGHLGVTSTTVSDPVMEGVSAIGIDVIQGNNIVITGGTSEFSGTNGMVVGVHTGVDNQQITVIGTDFEGNGTVSSANGVDILDNGAIDTYIGILATSNCTSACSGVWLNGNGTSSNDLIWGGLYSGTNNSGVGGVASNGIVSPGVPEGTCTPTGSMAWYFRGAVVKVPYC